jgi:hypothetical protein
MTDQELIAIVERSVALTAQKPDFREIIAELCQRGATVRMMASSLVATCPLPDHRDAKRICELAEQGHLDHIFDKLLASLNS